MSNPACINSLQPPVAATSKNDVVPFPVSETDVAAAEAALGGVLPASHRRRLMRENGGAVPVGRDAFQLFKILDRSTRKRLARTSATSIVHENQAARLWEGFPANAVAFAANGAGDYLVYLRNGDCLGPQVFWWDHETGELHHVANDVGGLLGI